MKPIRTYNVTVDGFPPVMYSARSPGKARARAFRDFQSAHDISFAKFLTISRVTRTDNPPGCGERFIVGRQTVTRIYDQRGGSHAIFYMRDDSDQVFSTHPADAVPIDAEDEKIISACASLEAVA